MVSYREVHRQSIADRDTFWRGESALVDWQSPFTAVLDYSKPPFAKWSFASSIWFIPPRCASSTATDTAPKMWPRWFSSTWSGRLAPFRPKPNWVDGSIDTHVLWPPTPCAANDAGSDGNGRQSR